MMIKKYILSVLLVATFASYALLKQITGANNAFAVIPQSNNSNKIASGLSSSTGVKKTQSVPPVIKKIAVSNSSPSVVVQRRTYSDDSEYENYSAPIAVNIPVSTPSPTPVSSPIPAISAPTPAPTPAPAPAPLTVQPTAPASTGQYKDGQYTGVSADAYYGNIQVLAVISGGKLVDVQFLDYPQDRNRSIQINNYAMPILKSEAIQAQSANVDIVSGATDSSGAFTQSLQSALSQALN